MLLFGPDYLRKKSKSRVIFCLFAGIKIYISSIFENNEPRMTN